MATIADLAVLVRSKNAGPFWLTIDIMFDNEAAYRRVRDSDIVKRTAVARMFGREPGEVITVNHDAAMAIKVSFPRPQSSGSKFDSDVSTLAIPQMSTPELLDATASTHDLLCASRFWSLLECRGLRTTPKGIRTRRQHGR